jgi:hypothetical protein
LYTAVLRTPPYPHLSIVRPHDSAPRRYAVALAAALVVAAALAVLLVAPGVRDRTSHLPPRLSDTAFWHLVADLSEPGGSFISDNYVSNESTFQRVIPELKERSRPGGVYLGVGPDQNFTYIAALEPGIAFIIDIRRENLLLHLMYKALIELSSDRAEFLSRLFSRSPPAAVQQASATRTLLEAFAAAQPDETLFERNTRAVAGHLATRHGFALSAGDLAAIRHAHRAFFEAGPEIRYAYPHRWFPTYADLMLETDDRGDAHSYLSSEETFRRLKRLETYNLIVPVVGDFAGSKAIRAVGAYLRAHGATVTVFYTSNVEFYLFENGGWKNFFTNIGALPLDANSLFIRASFNAGPSVPSAPGSRSATRLNPIKGAIAAFEHGLIRSYTDVIQRSDSPSGQ